MSVVGPAEIANPALYWPWQGPPSIVHLRGPGPIDQPTGRPTSLIEARHKRYVVDADDVWDLSPYYGRFLPVVGRA